MASHLISLLDKQISECEREIKASSSAKRISHWEEQLQTWNEIKRIVEHERQSHRKDSKTSASIAG